MSASDVVSIPGLSAAPSNPLMHFNVWQLPAVSPSRTYIQKEGKKLSINPVLKELS